MYRLIYVRALVGAVLLAFVPADAASAQHEGHNMPGGKMAPGPLGISMERMGSGTTWIPDDVTLPSRHAMFGAWELMFHGFGFLQYNKQNGPRGDAQLGSVNWMMLMATRRFGGSHIQARTMLSIDPWTVGASGYPLLLQTGETHNGVLIVDRQHPHDFWKELGILYEQELGSQLALSLYAAPSGEPALGPVAFMHRPSAMDNPVAPLGHHWQDATHISYGVLTAGIFTRDWKLEGSYFNGREPDEQRFAIDPIRLDSYSGRLTINPSQRWSVTVGLGFLKSPESLHPEESMYRMVASVTRGRKLARGQWATTFVMGSNTHAGESTFSGLVESEAVLDRTNTWFARMELVQRNAEELALPSSIPTTTNFNVGAASFGATTGLGVRGTLNVLPAALATHYGSRNPTGFMVFLRIRPFHSDLAP
jgi:hypothetical protein